MTSLIPALRIRPLRMLPDRTALILLLFLMLWPFGRVEGGCWLFVSLLEQKQIVTFDRNPADGELSRQSVVNCPAEPACLAASPDRRYLYVSLRSTGQLASFRIDPHRGQLTLISVVDGGRDPAYLLPDHTGRFLLSAYYEDNKVTKRVTVLVCTQSIGTLEQFIASRRSARCHQTSTAQGMRQRGVK